MRANTLLIRTPEGISFPLWIASPVTRFLAWAVDVACLSVLGTLIGIAAGSLGWINPDFAFAVMVLAYFVMQIGYGIATEWFWRGQTLGKRLLRLRVVDEQGLRLRASQIVMRNLLRFVDSLPLFYALGGLVSLLNRRGQRLGDIVANTVVVRLPRFSEPDLQQVLAGKFNSFREHPHLAARLRRNTSPQEAAVALQAVLRRDEFEAGSRLELFRDLAGHFRRHADFPTEAAGGLTDEQYVRNVVDILYRTERQGASS